MKQKMQSNQYFQFYISRYPFPQSSITLQAKLYKTFYECEGFQLTSDKLVRLTGTTKLKSLIKLKQIVKNVSKTKPLPSYNLSNIPTHNYSLFYEIVEHFILSPLGLSILKSQTKNSKEYCRMFETLFEDIEALILQQIYFIIDIQNFGITTSGHIKLYLPANFVLEETIFTENHGIEMRTTANVTIEYIVRNIQSLIHQKGQLDIESIRQEIKKQVASKIQIIPKNIESQIFTFNQKPQSLEPMEDINSYNQDLQKTVKIRKSSQKIEFIPAIEFSLLKHSLSRDAQKYHIRSMTSREQVQKEAERPLTRREGDHKKNGFNDHQELIDVNPLKENQFLKQRMKDYEEKLQSLNNTVKLMKQELITIGKKEITDFKKQSQNQSQQNNNKSKSCTNLSQINESREENISIMAEKLSTSRLQIKKLLHDDAFLKKSYLVEEKDEQQEQIDRNQEQILNKQIQNLIGSNRIESPSDKKKKSYPSGHPWQKQHQINQSVQKAKPSQTRKDNNSKDNQLSKQKKLSRSKDKTSNKRPQSNLKNLKQTLTLNIKDQNDLRKSHNRGSPNSYDYQSSLGKYSSPGGNPFRQYGNFRIEYVIDQEEKSKVQSPEKKQKMGGHIQIHRDPSAQPYRIVKSPVKKEHFFYPVVHIREPFRYSCLAIPKISGEDYEYIAIPQNMYDPTQYDSVDTFQMELGFGKQHKMPSIVSKDAFRHTLFPSTFVGKLKTDQRKSIKVSKERQENSQRDSSKKQPRSNKIFESAGGKSFVKYIHAHISEQNQLNFPDDLYQRKSHQRLPKIKEAAQAFHEISMDVETLSNRDKPKLEKKESGQSYKSNYKFEGTKYSNKNAFNGDDKMSRLSKTAKDFAKILKKQVSEQKNAAQELKKVQSRQAIQPNKKPIDKQKMYAVLNKSKQIISRYKNISLKKD